MIRSAAILLLALGIASPAVASGPADRVVGIAIETDHEFFDQFADTEAAELYVDSLIDGLNSIFAKDVGVEFALVYLSLWPDGTDPWGADRTGDIRDYWVQNRPQVEYALLHGLFAEGPEGLASNSGLCSRFSWSFSRHGSILRWKNLHVVAHEIGHNFRSAHTHCYQSEIDRCSNNAVGSATPCYQGKEQPAPRNGGGSIMSYCGTESIAPWFGRVGFYGEGSERVPDLMRLEVESVNPLSTCPKREARVSTVGDEDGDLIPDGEDNCELLFNPSQFDIDEDGFGNRCDPTELKLTLDKLVVAGLGGTRSKLNAKFRFDAPPNGGDPLTSRSLRFWEGYEVRLEAGDGTRETFQWNRALCTERTDRALVKSVRCKDPGTRSTLKLRLKNGEVRGTARVKQLSLPLGLPTDVSFTLTHVDSGIDRTSAQAPSACTRKGTRLICR